jgi:hypothetical protein
MKKRESIDLALILIWPIVATVISLFLKTNSLWTLFLFFVLPSLYLGYRGKEYVKKVLIYSTITTIPLMIWIEYIAEITGTWFVPSTSFPFKLFGLVAIEVILWAFLTAFFILIFYEYFINKHRTKKLYTSRLKHIGIAGLILLGIFIFLFLIAPSLLKIPYFYMFFGVILLLIPFLVQMLKYPKTTSKFFLAGAYFFYFHFILEVVGLKLGLWTFPGTDFIGWINIFGVGFPIEELIFWFILLALTTISYYEYFDDDEK